MSYEMGRLYAFTEIRLQPHSRRAKRLVYWRNTAALYFAGTAFHFEAISDEMGEYDTTPYLAAKCRAIATRMLISPMIIRSDTHSREMKNSF